MRQALAPLALVLFGCASPTSSSLPLGFATFAPDFDSYRIRRVGLLPLSRDPSIERQPEELEAELLRAFGATRLRVEPLHDEELRRHVPAEGFGTGERLPLPVLSAARRRDLDGLLVGRLEAYRRYEPQRVHLSFELVALETGLPIWTARLELDATSQEVRRAMQRFGERELGGGPEQARAVRVSPLLFARFAARELVRLL